MDTSSLISNSWLSGYIEAGGSFQVRTSLKSKYTRLGCSLEISQARTAKNGHDTSFFFNDGFFIIIFLINKGYNN